MDSYMNWLGEGFLEFCGGQYSYSSPTEQNYLCPRDGQSFYGDLLDFQPDPYFDSGESDQENFYYETQAEVPSPVNDKETQGMSKPNLQRKAANMRERKRMKSINDAFERLRDRIPTMSASVTDKRRISKVDTLRLAIRYISYLSKVVKNCGDINGNSKSKKSKEKIILRCHVASFDEAGVDTGLSLIGHSLSCTFPQDGIVTRSDGSTTLTAKIWTPQVGSKLDF